MKYLLPLLLLTGCAAPKVAQVPPRPDETMVVGKAKREPQPVVVAPPTQSFRLSWDYWAEGVRFSELFSPLQIVLEYSANLKTWTRLATLPPTQTNLTVNLTRVPCGAFRLGYTGL